MLNKQGFNIPFGQGLDTKTDPNTVVAGKMLGLQNITFGNGPMSKRNGFGLNNTLPDTTSTNLVTLNGNLLATGTNLQAYAQDTGQWVSRGAIQPVQLGVLPVVRTSASQITSDCAIASNGLACIVNTDSLGNSYYSINDSTTGQVVVPLTQLVSTAVRVKVNLLGSFFIITYFATIGNTTHLQYLAISQSSPTLLKGPADIATNVFGLSAAYDAVSSSGVLYLAYDATDGLRSVTLNASLVVGASVALLGSKGDFIAVSVDESSSPSVFYVAYHTSGTSTTYVASFNTSIPLSARLAPTAVLTATALANISCVYSNSLLTVVYEKVNTYSYSSVGSNLVATFTVNAAGAFVAPTTILRSVGLASKLFSYSGKLYVLSVYAGAFQPTYFLHDLQGNIIMRLAGTNAAGYITTKILPTVGLSGGKLQTSYLVKTLLQSVNKSQGAANVAGIYAQTGINLATFSINSSQQYTSEIASNLHLTGGMLWQYDGVAPVEHGFHVYPEDLLATQSTTGGLMVAQTYFYSATYEWTDAQGVLHRSAPSVPLQVVVPAGTATSSVTINVPTLRLTYKGIANPVRILLYRWSTAQQNYYQVSSISNPSLNNAAVDNIAYVDIQADSAILGNSLLYTTGGVIENIASPAVVATALFKSRLFTVYAEDRNVLGFSKQVLSGTPVELSNLLTRYVAPTTGAQGSTGGMTAISSMDDKLIIFKRDAAYYMTGTGPDNLGLQNDFSDPIFITGSVGCANPSSIVLMPQGLMFQSDKGIWLLGRNLSTSYIGADVEAYNNAKVLSALTIPGTNEVRFTLDNGVTLMYDYYYSQWSTFVGIPAISSTLYNGLHTILNKFGQVLQETPGLYLDNSNPVLLSFTTAWLKLTNLQGFQRAYCMYMLGNYKTPHKLNVQIAYDYQPTIQQNTIILPTNSITKYGDDPTYGNSGLYGGSSALEQWRVHFNQQKCQAIQITVQEVFDGTKGVPAGAGLTISGINLLFGAKASTPKVSAAQSAS